MIKNITIKQILKLWQEPEYNGVVVNLYEFVNNWLRGEPIDVTDDVLRAFSFENKERFIEFLKLYSSKLYRYILKHRSTEYKVFYRGEHRKDYDGQIGDEIFYKNFHSASKDICLAFGMSSNIENHKRIMFVIYLPIGSSFLELKTKMITYNKKDNIKEIHNENEIILPMNSKYIIINKEKLGDVSVYKITPTGEYFKDDKYDIFKENFKKYWKIINKLRTLKRYFINENLFDLLSDSNIDELFNKPDNINKMINICEKIKPEDDIKYIAESLKELGIGYYDHELKYRDYYLSKVCSIKYLPQTKFKFYNGIVYVGYLNFNKLLQKYKFIEYLENNKTDIYNNILIGQLTDDLFAYNSIGRCKSTQELERDNKKILIYYKYICRINLKKIKIGVCEKINSNNFDFYQTYVLILPAFKITIDKIKKMRNKYGNRIIYYDLTFIGE
jgi:hypothetical protein